ncbi:two-component system sensor histidine kinase CreC [Methylibium petroleiphilum]|uniref:two-component system sensor histidine kinase CreC n=1 Tax=Methylibium petroleiphilum TaxID=105560 RepID=UPI001AC04BF9|nr:two-component system sensor histidine kinase CreC [Methylibium petroleiphilum]MBN9205076.1 two-component system sensor histidine kinase CreC [Methylibium petroleiphilum]
MTKRNRIFIGILLAYALGVALLLWRLVGDIDPRYRESAEESLVETAHLMASWIESRSSEEGIAIDALRPVFRALYAREFKADIFGFEKTRVELRATVVDRSGLVLFDSLARHEGEDHSAWRDVRLALAGEYGARTSADVDGDPHTSVMYVAAPIVVGGEIVGAVSVGKPVQSFGQFVEKARRRTLLVGATSVAAVLLLVVIVSMWLVRPFGLVADVWRSVRAQKRGSFSLRRLGRRTWAAVGAAYDDMRDALAGRNYVADYVQTLTHELKSPLSAIRGAAELLNDEPAMPEADRQRFLGNIQRETLRIQELVDRMMELAALESRRQIEHPEAVALRPLLDELAASAQPVAAARRIEVVVLPGESNEEAVVEGDALLLRRAIGNLLDNAIDFSPTGGRVTLALAINGQRSGSVVDIIVCDQGPGIPDYADDKVFERFYSLARPHSQKKSTGLGLAFVKEIAELHRGRVSLRNAGDGVGAVAVLSLPLVALG